MICPKCGTACERDEADVGIGTIGGPWGCPACHWFEEKFSLVEMVKQAHALQDAEDGAIIRDSHVGTPTPPTSLDAKGWHLYFIRLAVQAFMRADDTHALKPLIGDRLAMMMTFVRHARERFAQAAQTLAGELPRTLKMHFDCDDGSLAVGTPPHDILWTAESLKDAKRVRDVLAAHGIPVEFTSDCEENCDGQSADEDE